jgi:hypothetical protein
MDNGSGVGDGKTGFGSDSCAEQAIYCIGRYNRPLGLFRYGTGVLPFPMVVVDAEVLDVPMFTRAVHENHLRGAAYPSYEISPRLTYECV